MSQQCRYCRKRDEDCRLIQLRFWYGGKILWHPPRLVCKVCRTHHLVGQFRYMSTKEAERRGYADATPDRG